MKNLTFRAALYFAEVVLGVGVIAYCGYVYGYVSCILDNFKTFLKNDSKKEEN